ncbi:UDP-N-acetylglucosamine 2-epimerase (non-hydrolyzing) [Algoriphagus kandeliae]|uniref:UDP-N-acetylglucosamine 2-epimerase (Non-hydrolyzing) n=1 Tax=Algoriphagus kandeliae TaxID=2562278 RepID=A0A4Y9R206_9BACT|nr:UDP-N-acetylglucosamine 2-epimerase (non-hydrolyzing) [Algoriphagus kandeliae]TFV97406.1 UDP-N-acetylglucosamine 2-epimerase (non-hydrolyzing) [Algoriphagus kandeliae]
MRKRILTVIGARPQFIKAAVLSRLIRSSNWEGVFEEILVHTGQHYDNNMSNVFFEEMEIPTPDYNLRIGSGGHGKMTGEMLIKIEELINQLKPDYLLVYGDTNSTLAGALASSKLHIPVIHIEAGLRSFNMKMPEEQNRILTDRLSTFLFAPTEDAVLNLANEGINKGVYMVGDIMYDASLFYRKINKSGFGNRFKNSKFSLATIHRAENTDNPDRLKEIFKGLSQISMNIILPLHPRTKYKLNTLDIRISENIKIIEPIGYFDMLDLEENAEYIFTDSGGVQKEAYFFKKPCFTLRDETEWVETVSVGWNTLVGANSERIFASFQQYEHPEEHPNLFGSGNTGELILEILKSQLL